jgi:membrane protease subunit HflC
MNRLINPLVLIAAALALLLFSSMVFTVSEREKAIKLRLGKVAQSEYEPGLHFKLPLIENVFKFDKRVLTLDVRPERVLTSEKKNVIVDSFVKWRIGDTETFYKRLGGEEQRADNRMTQFVREAIKNAFGQRTVREVVSSARGPLMAEINKAVSSQVESFGIEIVDVRVKKVELPEQVRESVYQRMAKNREKIAREIRSQGKESAQIIRAAADRVREETLATAYAQSEETRGGGDAESARTYAEAFTRNPEFYSLYRSLGAYRNAFGSGNDVLLLKPDSEFFKYFNNPQGTSAKSSAQ